MGTAGGFLFIGAALVGLMLVASKAGAASGTPSAGTGQGTGGGSLEPSLGAPSAEAMLAAAQAAAAAHIGYSTSVNTSGLLSGFRSDCSGFVSWVLHMGGVNVGDATTVTLPSASGIVAGVGQQVTLWNRPQPGQQGHVIINILGQWFESGGQLGGGVTSMTAGQAAQELGVSDLSQLGPGPTPNGFSPLHPQGL